MRGRKGDIRSTNEPRNHGAHTATPQEIEEVFRNVPTPAEMARFFEQSEALSKRCNEAVKNAESGLKELYDIATKAEEEMAASAARELLRVLQNTLLALNSARSRNGTEAVWMGEGSNPWPEMFGDPAWPSVFQKLARERESWPVLFHVHPDRFKDETKKVVTDLEVGSESGLNVVTTKKKFSLSTPANIIVINLKDYIEGYRKHEFTGKILRAGGRDLSPLERDGLQKLVRTFVKLPPLSREAAVLNAWRKAGDDLLPFLYGEDYEKHPSLVGILKGTTTETRAPRSEEKAMPWWDRDVIAKAIKAGWKSVAPPAREQNSEK
jgi:hypothetical protein